MTKTECKKRAQECVQKLNSMNHRLRFSFYEKEEGLFLRAENKTTKSHFGCYEITVLLDDFKRKSDAYTTFCAMLDLMLAGTELEDPKSYHNFY